MSDSTGNLKVTADVSEAVAALARLADVQARLEEEARGVAAALNTVEGETKKLAGAREEAANQLDHEAKKLRIVGAAQSEISAKISASIQLRIAEAEAAGEHGRAVKLAGQLELETLRQTQAERKESEARSDAAAKDRLAQVRQVAAAESAASKAAAAAERDRIAQLRQIEAAQKESAAIAEKAARAHVQAWEKEEQAATAAFNASAKLVAKTKEEVSALQKLKTAGQDFLDVGSKFGSIATGVQSLVAGAQQLKQALDSVSEDTIAAQRATQGLQIGITQSSAALGGYVDDVQLAQLANKAFALGVVETDAELAALAAGVKVKAEELGEPLEKLLDDAIIGIGRKSSKILDNLAIILNQTKAEEIYAESLGVTVEQLTALEKENAFAKASLIEFNRAAKATGKGIDGLAASYEKGKVSAKNFMSATLGFSDSIGQTREALRQLGESDLDRLGFVQAASKGTAAWKDANKILGKVGLTLDDVRQLSVDTGRDVQDILDKNLAGLAARTAKAEKFALAEQIKSQVAALEDEAGALEHEADLIAASGGAQRDTNEFILLGLEARLAAAEVAGEELGIVEATRALEVARAKQTARRGGGKRRDPNAELKRRVAGELAVVDARRQLVEASQALEVEDERRRLLSFHLVELAREELRVRELAALETKTKTKDEAAAVELELLAVKTERRLLDFEVQQQIRADERVIAEGRLTDLSREIELLQARGVATQILEQQRLDAEVEIAERFGSAEEQAALDHQIQIARIDEARAAEVASAAARLLAFNQETEILRARGQVVEHEAERRLELEGLVAEAEGDADARRAILHQREVARIEDRVKRQQQAITTTNSFMSQGQQVASLIVNQAIKDDEKRQKAQLRVQGLMAIGIGMLEVVKSVSAFASFNFIQGALHAGAAALAFAQGAIMVSGRTSKGGGSSGGGGAAGAGSAGGSGPPANTVPQESAEARDLPETPASAEELSRLRGGPEGGQQQAAPAGSGGTVIQINSSTMISGDTGTMLSDLTDRQERKAYGSDG